MDALEIAQPVSIIRQPKPFGGWALNGACHLDSVCPSFLSHLLYAGRLKRQAIFACIAQMRVEDADEIAARMREIARADSPTVADPLAQIARALVVARAKDIVGAVFGDAPDGLLGLLARVGASPFPYHGLYQDCFDLFVEPKHRARVKVLQQIEGDIGPTRIDIVRRLDPVLVHKAVVTRLVAADQVDPLHRALELIRTCCSTATDAALRRSLEEMQPTDDLGTWGSRWLMRMDRLRVEPPFPLDDPDLKPVYAEALLSLGRRYRNCAASRSVHVALGRIAILEWLHEPGAVAELRRLSDGRWLLANIFGKANRTPDKAVAVAVHRKLVSHGVLTVAAPHGFEKVGGLARLLNVYDIDDDDWDIDHIGHDPDVLDGVEREVINA